MDYLYPCLVFVWLAYIWETYLHWRQRSVYQSCTKVPSELDGVIDDETFQKSRVYQLDKSTFSLIHDFFKQMEFLVIIMIGFFPMFWNASGFSIEMIGYKPSHNHEIKQSIAFLLLLQLYGTVVDLPWTLYSTFVIEEKHGFNKQTVGFFIKDTIKKFLLNAVLQSAIVAGLIWIIQWGGEYFYVYAWVFILVVSLLFIFIYHDYIAPLFDKFTPLPEGGLRSAIEALATSLRFPLKKLLVVEGSKRSAHSNAYFYGFWWNKYIVLFDTLLEKGLLPKKQEVISEGVPPTEAAFEEKEAVADEGEPTTQKTKGCNSEEILAVLAHELGHWKLSHNLKNMVIAEINFFVILFLFGHFINQQDLFTSFGFPDSKPILIGLLLILRLIFLPYNEVFSFAMVQVVRRFEYQADAFASSLGKAALLMSALTKLHKDNLSFPIADPLYSAFNHSHPTLLERLRELQKFDKKPQ